MAKKMACWICAIGGYLCICNSMEIANRLASSDESLNTIITYILVVTGIAIITVSLNCFNKIIKKSNDDTNTMTRNKLIFYVGIIIGVLLTIMNVLLFIIPTI